MTSTSRQEAQALSPALTGPRDWFLTPEERGNPDTRIDRRHLDGRSWTDGNTVNALIHGEQYFARLLEIVARLGHGDLLLFTDWRSDPEERLADEAGTEVARTFAAAARRGAVVRGLLWRSHHMLQFAAHKNRTLGQAIDEAGGECLLDMRVPPFGSHHQKLVVVRHASRPADDVAFVGGIDLCFGRRDGEHHRGDPQGLRMADVYGDNPPWHDVQLEIRGPAVGDVEVVFRERWEDTSPLSRHPLHALSSLIHKDTWRPGPLPPPSPDPAPRGTTSVQLLRTYAARTPGYPFARQGERSVARGYRKVLRRASRLVYVEDQYLWSAEVASVYAEALRREPELRMVFVIPGYPEDDGRLSRPPNIAGRLESLRVLQQAGGQRFAVYWLENESNCPVYVHAKVVVVDDDWACVGSDNANRRSWTHDSELSAAVWDASSELARDLRGRLAAEHLALTPGQDVPDQDGLFAAFASSAARLDAWHSSGRAGPRPPGRLRAFRPGEVGRVARLWATPAYRVLYDPDGRPRQLRRRRAF